MSLPEVKRREIMLDARIRLTSVYRQAGLVWMLTTIRDTLDSIADSDEELTDTQADLMGGLASKITDLIQGDLVGAFLHLESEKQTLPD